MENAFNPLVKAITQSTKPVVTNLGTFANINKNPAEQLGQNPIQVNDKIQML